MTNPILKTRIASIDLLRGLVMVIMALDHCRDFFHADSVKGLEPFDFSTTTPAFAFTRWITHFCAPIFIFLAGTSICFMAQRKSPATLSKFLLTRGLWLMIMELTIVNLGWEADIHFGFIGFFVIWVIGLSMVIMAAVIHLPKKIILAFGLIMVLGHNLLDPFNYLGDQSMGGFLYSLLHVANGFMLDQDHIVVTGYPLIPWLGVMMLGYSLGSIYNAGYDAQRRKKFLAQLGLLCIALFILLRTWNLYGEPKPWDERSGFLLSLFSFLNTSKYPPSLHYLLMTLGPALIFLAYSENWKGRLSNILSVYGRVPFFYYLLHVYLIHIIALAIFLGTGHHLPELNARSIGGFPPGYGVDLWLVYVLWICVVVMLYFPCKWYDKYKREHDKWWLSYI